MCRKWYPLETKDVNKEFLDDIESDSLYVKPV